MKWTSNIWHPKQVVVIFVELGKDQKRFSAVKTVSGAIGELKEESFETLALLVKHFGTSKAYWLQINGTGVLTRLVDRASGYKEDLIINGDKDDFMFTSWTDGEKSAVSFVRKKSYEEEIETLKSLKAHILGISCGPVCIFEGLEPNEEYSGEFNITKDKDKIKQCSRNETNDHRHLFRTEFVTDNQLLANSILTAFKNKNESFENGLSKSEAGDYYGEYVQHKRFNILGVGGVFLILLLVLVNYFYTNSLNNQIAQLETDLALSNDNLSLLDRLDQEKSRKEQLVENSGFLGNKYISYYLDKIGMSVPSTVTLKSMLVFPLNEKLKEKRRVEVDTKKIEIEGATASSVVLDDWIEKLNRFEWVHSVEVLNYTKVDDQKALFKIIMILSK